MPVQPDERIAIEVNVALEITPHEWEALVYWLESINRDTSRTAIDARLADIAGLAVHDYIKRCTDIYTVHKEGPPK